MNERALWTHHSARTTFGPSAHLPICPSAHLPICPSAHLPICPSAHLPICPSAYLPICPSAHLPICPSAPLLLLRSHLRRVKRHRQRIRDGIPAATQRLVELHHGYPLQAEQLGVLQLGGEQFALRVEHVEVIVHSTLVPEAGEPD